MTIHIRAFRKALRRLERLISDDLKQDSLCCGVTSQQCHVLLEISETGPINLKELASRLGLDKGNVSRTIDVLVGAGLVHRTGNPDKRREVTIGLTPLGEEKAVSIHAVCDRIYREVFRDWPEEKINRTLDGLDLLGEALHAAASNQNRFACKTEEK